MSLKTLKPGEGRYVVVGFVLSFFLHLVALVGIGIVGSWIEPRDGALLVLPFITFMGVTQWIYLGPAAWLLRWRGSTALATGVLIAGGFVTLANALYYVGFGLQSLQYNAEVRRIQQREREHPWDSFSVDGVVTLVDDKHFEFRREDDGTVLSLLTWEGLQYIFLRKDGGTR